METIDLIVGKLRPLPKRRAIKCSMGMPHAIRDWREAGEKKRMLRPLIEVITERGRQAKQSEPCLKGSSTVIPPKLKSRLVQNC